MAAAEAALADSAFSWIKESALRERAYFMGLYNGLEPLADGNSLSRVGLRAIATTMSPRDGDDPFRASHLGRDYRALVSQVQSGARPVALGTLKEALHELHKEREGAYEHALRLLDDLERRAASSLGGPIPEPGRKHLGELCAELERPLRQLASPPGAA
jgi:hypothetical protein